MWRTCVMRVFQVEERGPLLLPDLLVLLQLLLFFPEFGRTILRQETFLKPHLAKKGVQRDGPHHEAGVKGESGPQDLHAGPGVSLPIRCLTADQVDRCWAGDGEGARRAFSAKRPRHPALN